MRDAARRWWSRPASSTFIYVLIPLFCLPPALLLAGPLLNYRIQADDYYHFGASRTWDRMAENLVRPHNLHVVAVFRFVNWFLLWVAGEWRDLPRVASIAAYLLLVLNMVACGRLVWIETGSPALGMACMVGLGGSTLLFSAVTFYAATPALWAALGILLSLLCLQHWRRVGGMWALVTACLASAFAIASWSGGYVVGAVAATYLWADGRPAVRRAAVWFFVGAASASALMLALTRQSILAAQNLGGREAGEALQPLRGLVHTIHAIPEMLILPNLGIETEITEWQAAVFCAVLLALWIWRHGRGLPITPLEASGAACVLVSYLLIYTARGYLPFSSLRTTPWYQTLPHFGAVLFVCGLVFPYRSLSESRRPLTASGILGAAMFAVLFCVVQQPVANRLFQAEVFPELSRAEAEQLAMPRRVLDGFTWEVAKFAAQDQRRLFAQFDRIEAASRQHGIARSQLLEQFGSPRFPGFPVELEPWTILDLAAEPGAAGPDAVRQSLGWLAQEQMLPHLALRPLIESIQGADPQTRTSAAIGLGLMGARAEPAVPALVKLLRDPDRHTRVHAAAALRRINPRTADKLGIK
jgi:hypothetical protein